MSRMETRLTRRGLDHGHSLTRSGTDDAAAVWPSPAAGGDGAAAAPVSRWRWP